MQSRIKQHLDLDIIQSHIVRKGASFTAFRNEEAELVAVLVAELVMN